MNSNEKEIVREVLASMADEAPPPVSFEKLTDTRALQGLESPRRSPLVAGLAGFVMIVAVIGGAIAITQRSTEDTAPPRFVDKDTIHGVWEVLELDGVAPIGRPGVTFSVVPDVNASINNVEPGQPGPGLAGPHFSTFGLCNNYGGTYTVDGDRVHTQLSGGTTLRGCSPEVSQQGILFGMLLSAADWSIADGLLTLTGDQGTVAVLREVDTTPAIGVWRLAELDGRQPVADISLDLSERGVVNGYAGCFIGGTYVVEGDQLTMNIIPPFELQQPPPELVCDEASDEELQFLSLLRQGQGTATGDELRFTSDTGVTAVFNRA